MSVIVTPSARSRITRARLASPAEMVVARCHARSVRRSAGVRRIVREVCVHAPSRTSQAEEGVESLGVRKHHLTSTPEREKSILRFQEHHRIVPENESKFLGVTLYVTSQTWRKKYIHPILW